LASKSKQTSVIFRPYFQLTRPIQMPTEARETNPNDGFTIMEVALAATVLAFTLVGMIGVIESGAQMLDLSRKQTMAAEILHSEIDQLRLQSWAVIAGEPPSVGSAGTPPTFYFYSTTQVGYTGTAQTLSVPGNGYPAGPTTLTSSNDPSFAQFVANYPQAANLFTLTRTVTCVEPAQSNNNPTAYSSTPLLLQITFNISWTGVTGRTYSRASTTLVGQNGLSTAYQRS
jgi:Tfp pilus assembly protein PilV